MDIDEQVVEIKKILNEGKEYSAYKKLLKDFKNDIADDNFIKNVITNCI